MKLGFSQLYWHRDYSKRGVVIQASFDLSLVSLQGQELTQL